MLKEFSEVKIVKLEITIFKDNLYYGYVCYNLQKRYGRGLQCQMMPFNNMI
jgi:hypothetical protein